MWHAMMAWNVTQRPGFPSPWEMMFPTPFPGIQVPFGARVLFHPKQGDERANGHAACRTSVECVFMGYHLGAGCRWTGEYEVAFVDQFAKTSLLHGQMHEKLDVMPQRTSKITIQDGHVGCFLRENVTNGKTGR